MNLVKHTDSILSTKCSPVKKLSKSHKEIIKSMFSVMYAENGIGLAAPQVGIPLQIIVVDTGNDPFTLINPKIVKKSSRTSVNIEGCLSFPGKLFEVERSTSIVVRAKSENWKDLSFVATGINAICIQHEYDHLMGITFDKIGKLVL